MWLRKESIKLFTRYSLWSPLDGILRDLDCKSSSSSTFHFHRLAATGHAPRLDADNSRKNAADDSTMSSQSLLASCVLEAAATLPDKSCVTVTAAPPLKGITIPLYGSARTVSFNKAEGKRAYLADFFLEQTEDIPGDSWRFIVVAVFVYASQIL